jgi:hypothetical protein
MRAAPAVLVHAVRDVAALDACHTALPRGHAYAYGAAIALGLLGRPPAPADVLTGPGDRAGLDAYALSLAVSPLDPGVRAAAMRGVAPSLGLELRARAREIAREFDAGETVSAMY